MAKFSVPVEIRGIDRVTTTVRRIRSSIQSHLGGGLKRVRQDVGMVFNRYTALAGALGAGVGLRGVLGVATTFEDMQLSLAVLVQNMKRLDGIKTPFAQARKEANELFETMRLMAVQSPAGVEQIGDAFNLIVAHGKSAGRTLEETMRLAADAASLDQIMGGNGKTIRDIEQAYRGMSNKLDNPFLGGEPKQEIMRISKLINKATKAGDVDRIKTLKGEMSKVFDKALSLELDARKALGDSMSGRFASMMDNIKASIFSGGDVFFQGLKDRMAGISASIMANPEEFRKVIADILDTVMSVGEVIFDLVKFVASNRDLFFSLIKGFLVFRLAQGVRGGVGMFREIGAAAGGGAGALASGAGAVAAGVRADPYAQARKEQRAARKEQRAAMRQGRAAIGFSAIQSRKVSKGFGRVANAIASMPGALELAASGLFMFADAAIKASDTLDDKKEKTEASHQARSRFLNEHGKFLRAMSDDIRRDALPDIEQVDFSFFEMIAGGVRNLRLFGDDRPREEFLTFGYKKSKETEAIQNIIAEEHRLVKEGKSQAAANLDAERRIWAARKRVFQTELDEFTKANKGEVNRSLVQALEESLEKTHEVKLTINEGILTGAEIKSSDGRGRQTTKRAR